MPVIGESLDVVPDIFNDAGKKLADEIEVFGYVDSRDDYMEKFSWAKIKHDYDTELVSLCNMGLY